MSSLNRDLDCLDDSMDSIPDEDVRIPHNPQKKLLKASCIEELSQFWNSNRRSSLKSQPPKQPHRTISGLLSHHRMSLGDVPS